MATIDWTLEPTDSYWIDASGRKRYTWPWDAGMDDEVAIDISTQLNEGESPTNLSCELWKLKATTEPAHVDVSVASLPSDPVAVADLVKQRVNSLQAGRVYRLKLFHGATGNNRVASVVIDVAD